MVDAALEATGFALIVLGLWLVSVPLALVIAGAGLVLVANRPQRPGKEGSADAGPASLPRAAVPREPR